MNWQNTKLIFRRELCDQWRDRRTIFTIVVMPLVLYPLMGMALLQTAQFMRQDPARVLVVGDRHWEDLDPPLIDRGQFVRKLAPKNVDEVIRLDLGRELDDPTLAPLHRCLEESGPAGAANKETNPRALGGIQEFMRDARYDLVIVLLKGDDKHRARLRVFVNSTSDRSSTAAVQVNQIIDRWQSHVVSDRLNELGIPLASVQPLSVSTVEVATADKRKAALWAKLLPFIVLVWALTGAFYPAIDLCAGEKERGTLETLLSSPARRSEIVAGKLLTVSTFSMATAILNLASMTFTGFLVIGQLNKAAGSTLPVDLGFPPLVTIPWLLLGLIPISALFGSLALALAAFARSSKEGQYYLIPMLMSMLPLMMLSMLPSTRLDIGTSLIPVTGMLLLLRSLMQFEYATALQFAGPVVAVTLVCCWLAARWAVYQFNNESVLFRSGEQFGVARWLRHVMRDRGLMPTLSEALMCAVIILVVKFFVGLSGQLSLTFGGFAKQIVITQIATIALPAILMAMFLTRGPRQSLKLVLPRFTMLPACMLLAILLHPAMMFLSQIVLEIYPPSTGLEQVEVAISSILSSAPSPWLIVLVIAIVPAICEELAFRGFILSGFQSLRSKWTAIFLSALFFGAAHGILQQSILAAIVGVVLGVIAVQTKSILPCIVFHATHNALPVVMSQFPLHAIQGTYMGYVLTDSGGAVHYTWLATILLPLFGLALLVWIWKNGAPNKNFVPGFFPFRRQATA